jgi:hypothetical protein
MTKEQLESFRKVYAESVKKCIKGKDKNGKEITGQSDWVFFDRDMIQALLDMTDPKTGGLKLYFGQYDKENLEILPIDQKDREDYIGRISIAIAAANKTESGIFDLDGESNKSIALAFDSRSSIRNGGALCPPECNP